MKTLLFFCLVLSVYVSGLTVMGVWAFEQIHDVAEQQVRINQSHDKLIKEIRGE